MSQNAAIDLNEVEGGTTGSSRPPHVVPSSAHERQVTSEDDVGDFTCLSVSPMTALRFRASLPVEQLLR